MAVLYTNGTILNNNGIERIIIYDQMFLSFAIDVSRPLSLTDSLAARLDQPQGLEYYCHAPTHTITLTNPINLSPTNHPHPHPFQLSTTTTTTITTYPTRPPSPSDAQYLVIDKEQLKTDGITDFYAMDKTALDACVAYYKQVLANTNAGDKSVVATCEVSDWLSKAGCQ